MISNKNSINSVKILGGMNYNLKYEKQEVTDEMNKIETIEISIDELTKKVNSSLADLDEIFYEEFLTHPVIFKIVKALREENYSRITPSKRIKIFAKLNAISSELFNGIFGASIYVCKEPIDKKTMHVNNDGVYFYKNIFNGKNAGLSNLRSYLYSIRKYIATSITDIAFAYDMDPDKLSGVAREYYDNMSRSILRNSWKNFIEDESEIDYSNQPIIMDAVIVTEKIMNEYCKELYREYGVIDKDMSRILYSLMEYKRKYPQLLKNRKRMVKLHQENIKKYDHELEIYEKYLKASAGDVASYSDDEFYALFNVSYYDALIMDEDGLLVERLNKLTNELVRRPFREFDLSNVEIPKYEFSYDKETDVMSFKRTYNGDVSVDEISSAVQAFTIALQDMSTVAQKNKLFKFNSEQEKQDYMEMSRWCDLKNHDYSDPSDKEVVNDGLNVILQKVSELYANIQKTSQEAINKSEFTPHGKTILLYQDKESYYDFHEFRNGYTKQEVYDSLMEYIREDVKDMEKKGVKEDVKTTR